MCQHDMVPLIDTRCFAGLAQSERHRQSLLLKLMLPRSPYVVFFSAPLFGAMRVTENRKRIGCDLFQDRGENGCGGEKLQYVEQGSESAVRRGCIAASPIVRVVCGESTKKKQGWRARFAKGAGARVFLHSQTFSFVLVRRGGQPQSTGLPYLEHYSIEW
jgi:hypothetical protein